MRKRFYNACTFPEAFQVTSYLTVAEFAQLEGLEKQQVLNRIHRKKIRGARKRGWFWEIPKSSLTKKSPKSKK